MDMRDRLETFKQARQGRRHLAGLLFSVLVGAVGYALFEWADVKQGSVMTIPWKYIPIIVAAIVIEICVERARNS